MGDEVGPWKEIIVKRVKLRSEVMWHETFAPYGIPILEDDILSGHVIENGCDCTKVVLTAPRRQQKVVE